MENLPEKWTGNWGCKRSTLVEEACLVKGACQILDADLKKQIVGCVFSGTALMSKAALWNKKPYGIKEPCGIKGHCGIKEPCGVKGIVQ